MHDLAKPFAVAADDRALQHQNVTDLLRKLMLPLGFSQQEIELTEAVFINNIFGHLLHEYPAVSPGTDNIRPLLAADGLRLTAARLGMDVMDYAALQEFFYICDNSSYLFLRERIFHPRNYSVSARLELSSSRIGTMRGLLNREYNPQEGQSLEVRQDKWQIATSESVDPRCTAA